MRSTSAEVHVDIMVPCDKAFSHIVPIDLANIFTGFRSLPAVKGMRDQTGTWDAASQSRTVLLSDGSSAQRPLQRTGFLPILPTPSKVSPASCASSRQKRMANGGLSKARLLNPPPFDGAISSSAEPVGWNHSFSSLPRGFGEATWPRLCAYQRLKSKRVRANCRFNTDKNAPRFYRPTCA